MLKHRYKLVLKKCSWLLIQNLKKKHFAESTMAGVFVSEKECSNYARRQDRAELFISNWNDVNKHQCDGCIFLMKGQNHGRNYFFVRREVM